jgi:hypothetical protein
MHWQGEIVADNGNFISPSCLSQQRRDPTTLRTLQVFENDNRNLRPLRRTQRLGRILRENRQGDKNQTYQKQSRQNSGKWCQSSNLHSLIWMHIEPRLSL